MYSDVGLRRYQQTLEVLLSAAVSCLLVAFFWKFGQLPTVLVALLAGSILLGLSSARAFAVVILLLAPIPSLGALIGVGIPVGLDPVNWLVILALGLAAQGAPSSAFHKHRAVTAVALLSIGVLAISWYRTYGQGPVSGSDIALILKPLIVVIAGFAVVYLLPRDQLVSTIALAVGGLLGVVAVSVFLQRLGLYETTYQQTRELALNVKQYGGIMLNGNASGSLVGIFSVPAFVLLRAAGYRALATLVLALALPVLFISVSRGGIAAFAAGVAVMLVFGRDRRHVLITLGAVLVLGGIWGATAGQRDVSLVWERVGRYEQDPNAALSGRSTIWEQAQRYLDEEPSRIFIGGGLDDFKGYNAESLSSGFAAHNVALRLLTDGGLVMLAAFALLMIVLWRASAWADPEMRTALRAAIAAALVFGLTHSMDVFSTRLTWLWVLTAAATAQAAARQTKPQRTAAPRPVELTAEARLHG
jgi:O-antigen ligase